MTDQRRLVIVGTTGMVGGCAPQYALKHPAVGRLSGAETRRFVSKAKSGSTPRVRGLLGSLAR
jgi:hypothetical protein